MYELEKQDSLVVILYRTHRRSIREKEIEKKDIKTDREKTGFEILFLFGLNMNCKNENVSS